MISGKIILKAGTKLTLNERFGEIAKQAPPVARIEQQTNVIIPKSRNELFGGKKSAVVSLANRLKKRSINYRLGRGNNAAAALDRPYSAPANSRVFQRLSFGNRRRGGGGASYVFGGQSGMGLRLRGQGRVGTRVFRSRTRGYLNNNTISRFTGNSRRGNKNNNNNSNNRGRRFTNRSNRGRNNGNKNFSRGRGNGRNQNRKNYNNNNNNNNSNITKEVLDNDLESYMARANLDTGSMDMNAA